MGHLPLEPVTLVSQWIILKIRPKTTYLNGVPYKEQRGGWVGGWKEANKRKKSGKAIRTKPEGKPLWK